MTDAPGRFTALRRWWRRWGGLVKLAVIAVALAALLVALSRDPAVARLGDALPWTLAALALAHVAFALMALRWKLAMRAIGVRFSFGASWAITAQSYFYYHVTPLSIGADVARFAKALDLARDHPKWRVIGAVMLDRALGFVAIAVVVAATAAFAYGWTATRAFLGSAWGVGLAALGVALVIAGVVALRVMRAGLAARAQELRTIAKDGGAWFAATTAAAVTMQVTYGLALWVGALGFGIALTPVQSVFAAAGSILFSLVPASLFGVGAAQLAGAAIYLTLGLSEAEAVLLVALGYLAHFTLGALGGLAEAVALDRRLGGAVSARRR